MGAFYGSIHFRTTDHAQIQKLLASVARKTQSRFYLAPTINGWTSAYPSDAGQDEQLSKSIAKSFPGELLHVLVHDDDIFAYYYYEDGKRIDQYNSSTDYFEELSTKQRQKLAGNPQKLSHFLQYPAELALLTELLRTDPLTFESERLAQFAKLLNLPNALTSYDYIEGGETAEIEQFDRFIHVPDRATEIAEQKQADDAVERQKDQLRTAGILLVEEQANATGFSSPVWCPDPAGDAFLVWWSVFNSRERKPLLRYSGSSVTPTALVATEMQAMACSASGRHLAIVRNVFPARVDVYDLPRSAPRFSVAHSRIGLDATFSPDEKLLATRGDEIVFTDVSSGKPVAESIDGRGCTHFAFHPSGSPLACASQDKLLLIDPASGSRSKTLLLRGTLGADTDFTKIDFSSLPALNERLFQTQFTADGELLLCASTLGLSVYRWSEVLSAQHRMPEPIQFAPASSIEINTHGIPMKMQYTYTCAHDPAHNCAIFAGLEGSIRSLDLTTGADTTLLEYAGKPPIIALGFSRDYSMLALTTRPEMFNPKSGDAQRLVILSYPALLKPPPRS